MSRRTEVTGSWWEVARSFSNQGLLFSHLGTISFPLKYNIVTTHFLPRHRVAEL